MAQGRSTEIITMIKWIRTSRLSIKELSLYRACGRSQTVGADCLTVCHPRDHRPRSARPSRPEMEMCGGSTAHAGDDAEGAAVTRTPKPDGRC